MRYRHVWFLLVAGVLLCALPAAAQMEKGLIEISPMIGYQWQTGGIPLEDGYQTALTLGYCFSDHIEGEFELTYGQANYYGDAWPWYVTQTNHINTFRASLLYNWNVNKWSPYVKLGLGKLALQWRDTSDAIYHWNYDTTLQFGGGFRYFFNKNWALRGEVNIIWYLTNRYYDGNYFPSGDPYPYDLMYVQKGSPYYWEAVIGVSFFFHRPAPPPQPPK